MSRDRKIPEQALKHELRGTPGPIAPDCIDAETLAAWEDGGLDAKAMEAATLHASTCARCQAMLGVMARGVPAAAPAEESKRFRLWSWWLAPIAAATAAVTLWIVVPREQQLATAPATPPAANIEAQPPAATPAAPATPPPAPATLASRDERLRRQAAPSAPKEEEARKLNEEPKVLSPSAAADATVAGAAPAAPPSTEAPARNAAPSAMLQKSAFGPVEIVSPNSTRRWRIVAGGVEFSTDQGASWVPVRANPSEVLTNGVSPSGTVCWLIGKNGVVLVTADGSIFAKVDLPVRVDVASIVAADARSASVTTVDGRTFSTADSGRNWRQN